MGGASLSTSSVKDIKWRAGGYIGGLYDIQLGDSWYIQPQLLFTYEENKAKDKMNPNMFRSQYALTLPVLASFKVKLKMLFLCVSMQVLICNTLCLGMSRSMANGGMQVLVTTLRMV